MSFFGNNARPDLLKNPQDEARNDGRFGEPTQGGAPEPAPSFTSESRTSYTAPATPTSGATPPDRCTNIVGAGARWKGALKVEESVRIDGIFSGEIEAKGTVHVSEGAEVDAKIHAAFVVISGTFRGEIRADQKAELLPTSQVSGEIITKLFSVQEGATLDGSVQMTGEVPRTRENTRNGRNGTATTESETAERRSNRSETTTPTTSN